MVVLGGGYVGMYTALGLQRHIGRGIARVTVVDPRSYMTYQPFLPEAAAGALEPRHVVVPLRKVLRRCEVITGQVISIRHADRRVLVDTGDDHPRPLAYDELVVAVGAVSRALPIPGLAEQAIGFKQVEEAIALRNQVLDRLDRAAATPDASVRSRALTFVFVGGGFAGVEALGELENMAHYALRYYPQLSASSMRWMLVEAADRILPEIGPEIGTYTIAQLRGRGIDVRLATRLESCVDGQVVLSDGDRFAADTIVWTAGGRANPILAASDLPIDDRGRVVCTPTLAVAGVEHAWSAGDNAAVPDLTGAPGATCAPNAQHAVRQAKRLAANIVAVHTGGQPREYRHKYVGSVASLGLYKGAADIYGVKLRGLPAWFMHRTYHMSRMPTLNRKIRVVADWTMALLFRREIVSLGRISTPRAEFAASAASAVPDGIERQPK